MTMSDCRQDHIVDAPVTHESLCTKQVVVLNRNPHDLRHSCASLLLVQGVPARVVMETLGHTNISITMDTYTHVLPELQRQAADAMDRTLGRGQWSSGLAHMDERTQPQRER
jgi:hypothetical protein